MDFTDRYQALGMPYPEPDAMCPGPCEGTGYYPQHIDDETISQAELVEWWRRHQLTHSFRARVKILLSAHWRWAFDVCDGWHFIVCPMCHGTGLQQHGTRH